MAEPITVGAMIATAISAGAAALAKGALGAAGKDAYQVLKDAVARWTGNGEQLAKIESDPASHHKTALAESVATQPLQVQRELAALAATLVKTLRREEEQSGPIGVDIGELEAMNVELDRLQITSGTGFRADRVTTTETFHIGEIDVGTDSGKA